MCTRNLSILPNESFPRLLSATQVRQTRPELVFPYSRNPVAPSQAITWTNSGNSTVLNPVVKALPSTPLNSPLHVSPEEEDLGFIKCEIHTIQEPYIGKWGVALETAISDALWGFSSVTFWLSACVSKWNFAIRKLILWGGHELCFTPHFGSPAFPHCDPLPQLD